MTVNKKLKKYLDEFQRKTFDDISIPQAKLDLDNNRNTNPFSYRGQFSPDLIRILLESYSSIKNLAVLDPFVGSGTVLLESLKHGHSAYGVEINPTAIYFSRLISIANYSAKKRRDDFDKVYSYLESINLEHLDKEIKKLLSELSIIQKDILVNIWINFSTKRKKTKAVLLQEALLLKQFIDSLPKTKKEVQIFHTDARKIPIENNHIDLVITSPPYINVFNYHQNHRDIMEVLDWDVLKIAKSEFGSNRKNRQNRFLTSIQYIFDMGETFLELKRVTKNNARIIFVVGKETTIRGVKFKNGMIITFIALACGLELTNKQHRKFKNRFGQTIYEDILHFKNVDANRSALDDVKNEISEYFLQEALKNEERSEIRDQIEQSISKIPDVQSSEIFNLNSLQL